MTFLEGSASALPKNSRRIRRCALQNFRRINSALRKIRHLAKASGMDRKILKGSHPALRTFMHPYTHARLHAYTPARGIVVDDEKLERRL
jgi:hypothetical protein